MTEEQKVFGDVEPERYELFASGLYQFRVDRRDFIKIFGAGIAFVVCAPNISAQESGRGGFNNNLPQSIDAWIHLNDNGKVTAYTGKVEVGQDKRSSRVEFTWAYFRPAGVIDVKSGVKADGTITAWEFLNYNSGSSGIQIKYDIANTLIQFHASDSPLRQGSYRGLAATANHFARESHMDELAHAVKMDPLEFRLKNIKKTRLRDVLQAAANKFGWTKHRAAAGHGYGLACGFEKNGYIATCAEVAIEKGDNNKASVRIVRVVEAFELRRRRESTSIKEPD